MRPIRQVIGPQMVKAAHTVVAGARRLNPGKFTLAGQTYRYFSHPHNETWRNERAVEVPPAMRLLDSHAGKRVLEVGNVLAHYGRKGHDVVDKYEQSADVDNSDILELDATPRYDLVLSVSTLEHVGFDEDVRDPDKPGHAVARMREVLAPRGTMLVTIPLGYNESLDAGLAEGRLPFDRVRCLRRVSANNRWEEVGVEEIGSIKYGEPFPWANGVAFGLAQNSA